MRTRTKHKVQGWHQHQASNSLTLPGLVSERTLADELGHAVVQCLRGGRVQAQVAGLQAQGEQAPNGVLDVAAQLLQHAVDARKQALLVLRGQRLQLVPELVRLRAQQCEAADSLRCLCCSEPCYC